MLPSKPLISIITINWNTPQLTIQFLNSLKALAYPNFEVIIVDNHSDIDSTQDFVAAFPGVQVIRLDRNAGFSGGNNAGIRTCKGEFIFIVNNDTEVTPDLLDNLLIPFQSDNSVGVTCPKIKFFDRPDIIQYAGFKPINIFTGRTRALGSLEYDKGQHDKGGYTNGAHGCAMMVSRKVIDKVGLLPENFFLYYEEWDWSLRILKSGFKIYYQPQAVIFHKESMTVGKHNPLKTFYLTRNRILFMRRNSNLFQFSVFLGFFLLFTLPKSLIKYFFKKQFRHLKYFLKGTVKSLTISKYSLIR
jgi:GT2 family glycosyltransferase